MKKAQPVILHILVWTLLSMVSQVMGEEVMKANIFNGDPIRLEDYGTPPATHTIPLYDCTGSHRPKKDDPAAFQVFHNGEWYNQVCQHGLLWNQTMCRCEYPGGKRPEVECRDYRATSKEPAGKYEQFVNGQWITRDCSLAVAGLVWDQDSCQCVWGPDSKEMITGQGITPCDIMLNITFEDGIKDEAKNSFIEVGRGSALPVLELDKKEAVDGFKAAYFSDTALNIWYFAGNEIGSSLRVEFRFKMTNDPSQRDKYQIFLSNGCNVSNPGYTTPSLAIGYRAADQSYLLAFETATARKAIVCTRKLGAYDWHTISLIYEDGTLLLRVDEHPCIISQDFSGPLQKTPCPLTIGADPLERESMYKGYLDNLLIARYCRRFMDTDPNAVAEGNPKGPMPVESAAAVADLPKQLEPLQNPHKRSFPSSMGGGAHGGIASTKYLPDLPSPDYSGKSNGFVSDYDYPTNTGGSGGGFKGPKHSSGSVYDYESSGNIGGPGNGFTPSGNTGGYPDYGGFTKDQGKGYGFGGSGQSTGYPNTFGNYGKKDGFANGKGNVQGGSGFSYDYDNSGKFAGGGKDTGGFAKGGSPADSFGNFEKVDGSYGKFGGSSGYAKDFGGSGNVGGYTDQAGNFGKSDGFANKFGSSGKTEGYGGGFGNSEKDGTYPNAYGKADTFGNTGTSKGFGNNGGYSKDYPDGGNGNKFNNGFSGKTGGYTGGVENPGKSGAYGSGSNVEFSQSGKWSNSDTFGGSGKSGDYANSFSGSGKKQGFTDGFGGQGGTGFENAYGNNGNAGGYFKDYGHSGKSDGFGMGSSGKTAGFGGDVRADYGKDYGNQGDFGKSGQYGGHNSFKDGGYGGFDQNGGQKFASFSGPDKYDGKGKAAGSGYKQGRDGSKQFQGGYAESGFGQDGSLWYKSSGGSQLGKGSGAGGQNDMMGMAPHRPGNSRERRVRKRNTTPGQLVKGARRAWSKKKAWYDEVEPSSQGTQKGPQKSDEQGQGWSNGKGNEYTTMAQGNTGHVNVNSGSKFDSGSDYVAPKPTVGSDYYDTSKTSTDYQDYSAESKKTPNYDYSGTNFPKATPSEQTKEGSWYSNSQKNGGENYDYDYEYYQDTVDQSYDDASKKSPSYYDQSSKQGGAKDYDVGKSDYGGNGGGFKPTQKSFDSPGNFKHGAQFHGGGDNGQPSIAPHKGGGSFGKDYSSSYPAYDEKEYGKSQGDDEPMSKLNMPVDVTKLSNTKPSEGTPMTSGSMTEGNHGMGH